MHGTYMPVNWQPQYPAWEPYWENTTEPLVAGYFGIQAEQPQLLDEWASQSLYGAHAPLAVEQGLHVDGDRARDFVYLAYWRQSDYRRWWALADNSGWWGDDERLTEGVGYWREIISMPFDRFETLHLSKQLQGVSVSAQGLHGPIREHGYPGSIRDRIPISESHSLPKGDRHSDSVALANHRRRESRHRNSVPEHVRHSYRTWTGPRAETRRKRSTGEEFFEASGGHEGPWRQSGGNGLLLATFVG